MEQEQHEGDEELVAAQDPLGPPAAPAQPPPFAPPFGYPQHYYQGNQIQQIYGADPNMAVYGGYRFPPYGFPFPPPGGWPQPPQPPPAPPVRGVAAARRARGGARGRGEPRARAAAARVALVHGAARPDFVAAHPLQAAGPDVLRRHLAPRVQDPVPPPPPQPVPENDPQDDAPAPAAVDPPVAAAPNPAAEARRRAGRPANSLDDYVGGFIVKDSKLFKGDDGVAVEALRCSICTTKFRVTAETRDKLSAIRDHEVSKAHRDAARANDGSFISLSSFLYLFSYMCTCSQRPLAFASAGLLEEPSYRQEMLCHAILRSGLSLQLIETPLFTEFLAPRHSQYATLQTADHLQRAQIAIAYDRDFAALKSRLAQRFHFLIFDETPNSKNVPLLNILDRSIDPLSNSPSIETALLSSKEIAGRCDAPAVVTRINETVQAFELETVLLLISLLCTLKI